MQLMRGLLSQVQITFLQGWYNWRVNRTEIHHILVQNTQRNQWAFVPCWHLV